MGINKKPFIIRIYIYTHTHIYIYIYISAFEILIFFVHTCQLNDSINFLINSSVYFLKLVFVFLLFHSFLTEGASKTFVYTFILRRVNQWLPDDRINEYVNSNEQCCDC